MSGSTIREEIQEGAEQVNYEASDMMEEVPQEPKGLDFSFLKAETGEGEIEDYITHPLNFNESRGTARVLRGLTGMFGSLRYAVIDIAIGLMEFTKPKQNMG